MTVRERIASANARVQGTSLKAADRVAEAGATMSRQVQVVVPILSETWDPETFASLVAVVPIGIDDVDLVTVAAMRRFLLVLFLTALSLDLPASAQRNILSVQAGQTFLTAAGHKGPRVSVSYRRDLTRRIGVQADIGIFRTRDQQDEYLLDADSRWTERTQALSTVTAVWTPLHIHGLGVDHRVSLSLGAAARYKNETFFVETFFPLYFEGAPPGTADQIVDEYNALGPDYQAYRFEYDDGPDGRQDGTYVALTLAQKGFDPGWTVGTSYEVRSDRVVYGVDAAYRRFANQGLLVGSHAADVTLKVGYRF